MAAQSCAKDHREFVSRVSTRPAQISQFDASEGRPVGEDSLFTVQAREFNRGAELFQSSMTGQAVTIGSPGSELLDWRGEVVLAPSPTEATEFTTSVNQTI
jgi:hypothetical protein